MLKQNEDDMALALELSRFDMRPGDDAQMKSEKGGELPSQESKSVVGKSSQLKKLQMFKIKMKHENVYIYDCCCCEGYMTMHEERCAFCSTDNLYYDVNLQVSEEAKLEVRQFLMEFITLSNVVQDVKPKPEKRDEKEEETKKEIKEDKKEEEPEPQPPRQLTVWICETCKRPNNLEDGGQCRTEKCEGDLEASEALEMFEIDINEYDKRIKEWTS